MRRNKEEDAEKREERGLDEAACSMRRRRDSVSFEEREAAAEQREGPLK